MSDPILQLLANLDSRTTDAFALMSARLAAAEARLAMLEASGKTPTQAPALPFATEGRATPQRAQKLPAADAAPAPVQAPRRATPAPANVTAAVPSRRAARQPAAPVAPPAQAAAPAPASARAGVSTSFEAHRAAERDRMLSALTESKWNRLQAADAIGMPRRTFYRRMDAYGIQAQQHATAPAAPTSKKAKSQSQRRA